MRLHTVLLNKVTYSQAASAQRSPSSSTLKSKILFNIKAPIVCTNLKSNRFFDLWRPRGCSFNHFMREFLQICRIIVVEAGIQQATLQQAALFVSLIIS